MESINNASKAIAKSIELLKRCLLDDQVDINYIIDAINLLQPALDQLADNI